MFLSGTVYLCGVINNEKIPKIDEENYSGRGN